MKTHAIIWLLCLCPIAETLGQNVKRQTDKHIVHQQERMVHKQWDRKKFTPTKGFLSLNYQYWITWALHPNYPKTDRRPLSGPGPQTLRMGMVLAMQQTDEAYKKHADTLRNVAVTEAANYSGLLTDADPLWFLYYRKEFNPLLESTETDAMQGIAPEIKDYLQQKGVYEWYTNERLELKERLEAARRTTLDRGSRILAYHRMLMEHRKLLATWEAKKSYAAKFLSLSSSLDGLQSDSPGLPEFEGGRSDVEIAEDILKRTR
ncbi:hypothetical protein [Sphingobacterium arenae]|uniref:DUF5045 domain-containing protein n=1 Tax=Sphingobacterium arenae TaxID=1280598 RepID=A0ABR7XYA8_9SPHI|nr:hypothetical protein [Sphingobacterium arenae]MBD1424039.1 hypothetical protein [Sphingobacterium arenae]